MVMNRRTLLLVIALLVATGATTAATTKERHTMTGLVLKVDPAHKALTISCEAVPGYMDAMTMPFDVREAKMLEGLKPGATVDFTFVVDGNSSYAEDIRVRRYQNLEQEPLEARRLELLSHLDNPAAAANALAPEQAVPDFVLSDQNRQRVSFAQLKGKVVALTFAYISCPNPSYCFRLSNNLGQLRKRFGDRLGRDLVLLTIIIDPEHDQGEALAKYARIWKADPHNWHFLTGPVPEVKRVSALFGMDFWKDEGFLTHSFHTAVIDRQGKIVANLEGNQFTAQQLGDLVQTVMGRP
jgi:protein SCO1/2